MPTEVARERLEHVVGIELVAACEAQDAAALQGRRSPANERLHASVRQTIARYADDRPLGPVLESAAEIVRKYGGNLSVESEMGKGTTFKIYIPAVVDGILEQCTEEAPQMPMGSGELILVVDDDTVVLKAVTQILQREGYPVVGIDDAVEGLTAAKDPSIDVAVLDIKMPNLSGMDLLRGIKAARPEVEVIMMTAFATVLGIGMRVIGPQSRDQIFHASERHHFPRDLGKALGASLDGDEALLIDADNVAGIVPALRRRAPQAREDTRRLAGEPAGRPTAGRFTAGTVSRRAGPEG